MCTTSAVSLITGHVVLKRTCHIAAQGIPQPPPVRMKCHFGMQQQALPLNRPWNGLIPRSAPLCFHGDNGVVQLAPDVHALHGACVAFFH